MKHPAISLFLGILTICLLGCNSRSSDSVPTFTPEPSRSGLTTDEVKSLSSLAKVDEYPLYTMILYGDYSSRLGTLLSQTSLAASAIEPFWGCSLFAALGDPVNGLFGRNFDWRFSPALLLFTDSPDGYASASMVDLEYFGFTADNSSDILSIPLADRISLLDTPVLPFDGMNEHGLAIGMAAVPESEMPRDPGKVTLDSIRIIREMLDHARDVSEAIHLLESYNIYMGSGPPIHYLMADAAGNAALAEFYAGELVILPNNQPFHLATNFLLSSVTDDSHNCWRYDTIFQTLSASNGILSSASAMDLLAATAQQSSATQWSVVYELDNRSVNVVVGQQYSQVHTFHLPSPP